MTEILNHVRDIIIGHKFHALFKNCFALVIHDVVIFEQVFPNIKIARFNADLRALHSFGHEAVG